MAHDSLQNLVQSFRRQIAQNEAELVVDQLQAYLNTSAPDLCDEAVLLASRYRRLNLDTRKGIVARDTNQVERAILEHATLELLNEVSKKVVPSLTPLSSPDPVTETPSIPTEVNLERILGVNNLKQISWIARGLEISKSICRVLTPNGLGSGFLIGANSVMTNHHVIPNAAVAAETVIEFNYQSSIDGAALPTYRYQLDTNRFKASSQLDYAIIGVQPDESRPNVATWGHSILNAFADPLPGEHVTIIQHPNGGLKQIALTANQVVGRWEHRLHYTTDTMPGSSGAPVFNDLWQVIAIHHGGGELQVNSMGDKRYVNEGILMSAIRADAKELWPV